MIVKIIFSTIGDISRTICLSGTVLASLCDVQPLSRRVENLVCVVR
jgi:hypothetical protein